jgi:hypothetical protein
MKNLRRVGLLPSFLIVGVLGGLMAPLPSEAGVPTLTLQVDKGVGGAATATNILGAQVTCATGFTLCYAIDTSATAAGNNGKSFRAATIVGAVPRLNIADVTSGDKMSVTGVQFIPTSTTNFPLEEVHFLEIVATHTYDAAFTSKVGAGTTVPVQTYTFGLHWGGYTQAGPSPVLPFTSKGNLVQMKGEGKFTSASTLTRLFNSSNPLPITVPLNATKNDMYQDVGNDIAKASFLEDQVSTFPSGTNCATSSTYNASTQKTTSLCKPTIILTMTATLKGPDSLVNENSADGGGGSCKLTPADGVESPTGPVLPCHSSGQGSKKSLTGDLTAYFTLLDGLDNASADLAGAEPAIACLVDCPCNDPYTCKGTIVTQIRVTPTTGVKDKVFNFTTVGLFGDGALNPFPITASAKGLGSYTPPNILTVSGGPWTIAEGAFPIIDANTFYDVDQIDCVSVLNRPATDTTDPFIVTTWTVGGTSEKGPLTVNQLGGGDTLTCTWHIHKNSSNP